MVKPYTLDDVVAALNQVTPHDWKAFLGDAHLRGGAARAARRHHEGRLAARLHRREERIHQDQRRRSRRSDVYSIGLRVRARDGMVNDVILNSPAGKAGIGPGMQILAVNGLRLFRGRPAQRDQGIEDRDRADDDRIPERRCGENGVARLSTAACGSRISNATWQADVLGQILAAQREVKAAGSASFMSIRSLWLHSLLAWAVLVTGLVAWFRAIGGKTAKRPWTPQDELWGLLLTISADLQLLVGLVLYRC